MLDGRITVKTENGDFDMWVPSVLTTPGRTEAASAFRKQRCRAAVNKYCGARNIAWVSYRVVN